MWTENFIKQYQVMVHSKCTDADILHSTIPVLLCQTQAAIGGDKSNQNHNPLTVHSVPILFNYYMFHHLPLIVLLIFILIVILYKRISLLHLSLFIHHSCILSTHGSWWCGAHPVLEKGVFLHLFWNGLKEGKFDFER